MLSIILERMNVNTLAQNKPPAIWPPVVSTVAVPLEPHIWQAFCDVWLDPRDSLKLDTRDEKGTLDRQIHFR